jgi:dynein heavy chain
MNIKITLEQVKSTLPLIQMLREPYMRERHWDKMQRLLGSIIDPNSDTFSIGEVFKLNLIQNAEAVREICEVAREEYKIESALAKIENTWEDLSIEMEPHKKTYKVKKLDDINAVLEEHMTTLAS